MPEVIVFDGDTDYGHYQVIDMKYEGRQARVLFSGYKDAAFSGVALDDNSDLLFEYNQRFLELATSMQPKSILLIGGGAFTLPLAVLQLLPKVRIDVVEIDDRLAQIAIDHFGLVPNSRLRIFHVDGRNYLQKTKHTYDMILIDAFDNLKIPAQLSDAGAIQLIQHKLNHNGIVRVNVIASYRGAQSEMLKRLRDLYLVRFKSVGVFPANPKHSKLLLQNSILIASRQMNIRYGLRYPEASL